MEKISLKADYAFKELFAHEKVRKQFLSDVLGIPLEQIKSVRIVNPFLRRTFKRQKQGIMDIALVLNDNVKIDIEMQVHRQKHYDLMIGERYRKLRRCISISLVDFELFSDTVEYHSVYRLRNEAGNELTDLWEVHIIELGKTLQGSVVDDWIRLLNATSQEEVEMIAVKNEGMREAVEVVRQMGLIRTLRWMYDDYWRARRDRWDEDEYVRDEGRAEGKAESIIHLLQNINDALSQELIQKIRGQKDEEILNRWLLSAAKAESVEQFRKQENL